MKRVKRNDNIPFGTIARDTLSSPTLSLKAKGLLAFLFCLPPQWKFSVSGLQKYCMEGRDAIHATLKELKEAGYMTTYPRRDKAGRMDGYDYIFRETLTVSFPYPVSPYPANPDTEKPDTVKPNMELPETVIPETVAPETESPDTPNPTQHRSKRIRSIHNKKNKSNINIYSSKSVLQRNEDTRQRLTEKLQHAL